MSQTLVGLARTGARAIKQAYEDYRRAFRSITHRAKQRFEQRDWAGGQHDAVERLELYRVVIEALVADLAEALGDGLQSPPVWRATKAFYTERIAQFPDRELAETFFNSATRKVFATVGVDPDVEYVDLDIRRDRYGHGERAHQTLRRRTGVAELVARALALHAFAVPWRDIEADAALIARELEADWERQRHRDPIEALDLGAHVFYRGSGAYLIGRVRGGQIESPLAIILLNGEHGVEADAVLTTEREISIVFSYTRSHFQVDVRRPADLIRFLGSIMPRKPLAELYISLGYAKHGKTEMYRDLVGHLWRSLDPFDYAPGEAGMVMIVFAQRSYDYVFKVIRDSFAPPKTNTREDVLKRYQLVFRHDRAGRLIEAQEFEHLIFEARRFAPELLEELTTSAASTVTVRGEELHIRHLYVERRVRPLNLFLREASPEAATRAVRDYGHAIRDLAKTNIFPGDMLLKNFGVTRHGRVTFYDYDELCHVTDCRFRDLPEPRDDDEALAAEPWFYVGDNDVFPEEFLQFMGLQPAQRAAFLEEHRDVLTADYWRELQQMHREGRVIDVFPYPASRRLRRSS